MTFLKGNISKALLVGGCLILAALLRVSNIAFVNADITGHLNFIDTDCYYYLRRLAHFLQNFPSILYFDPLADWPNGSLVDWPEIFLLILGVPLKIFGVDSYAGLEWGACILMVLLGLLTCFAVFFAGLKTTKHFAIALIALFFASVNFILVRFSCLGQVDHHILESAIPVIIFLLALRAFQAGSKFASILLGLSMTLSLGVSSSSLFAIFAFYLSFALILSKFAQPQIFLMVASSHLLSLIFYASYVAYRFENYWAFNRPSFMMVSWILGLIFMSAFIGYYRFFKKHLWILLAVFSGVVSVFAFYFPIFTTIGAAFDYVFKGNVVLRNVSEARPLFMNFDQFQPDFAHVNFGYFIYVLPLAWVLLFRLKKLTSAQGLMVVFLSVLSIPALAQKRFSHLMVCLFLVFLAWIIEQIVSWFEEKRSRWGIIVAVAVIILQAMPTVVIGLAPMGSARDRVDLSISNQFLKSFSIDQNEAWGRLGGKLPVEDGFWANPNMGHMMLYYTGYGAVTNSFYKQASFDLDFKLRTIESDSELKNFLATNRIRYLIAVDDWKFLELQYRLHNRPTPFTLTQRSQQAPQSAYDFNQLVKYATARLVVLESVPSDFKRVFSLRINENHFYTFARGYEFLGSKP